MLTKEQEEKISGIAGTTWAHFPGGYFQSVGAAIAAGIKAYDEIQDVEEVKAAVKAVEEKKDSDNGAYVVFRPHGGAFADAISAIRVFENKEQMLNKLKEEYGEKVAIGDDEVEDDRIGWLHSQYVTQEFKLRFGGTANVVIGICDCKTFKRG